MPRRRYWDSVRGERRNIAPVVVVIRISWSAMASKAAMARDSDVPGRMEAVLVRGRRVIVVGTWPPREKVVRWRRSCPWRDFGSVGC